MIMIIVSRKRVVNVRHSRQRDAILDNLCSRCDHPTAEDIYFSLKSEMPALSLATVYRNLSQLEGEGKVLRIDSSGTARYDGNLSNHYHLSCLICGGIFDIFMNGDIGLLNKAQEHFDGKVLSQCVIFSGYCPDCSKQVG